MLDKLDKKATVFLSSIIISVGIFGAGFCIGKAFYLSKFLNRHITVKGLTERDVKSDLGIWEIDYREIGGNLTELNQRIQHDQTQVVAFLKQQGFTDQEIAAQPVKLDDKLANAYAGNNNNITPEQRYIVTSGIRVRSNRVAIIQQSTQAASALLQQGVPLAFDVNSVSPNPSYYFTGLDAIRPSMMADATRSARSVAEQFAQDSGTVLGGIQTASQGVFQIMSRDTSTMSADWNSTDSALGSIDKKVRLVTTVDYRLK